MQNKEQRGDTMNRWGLKLLLVLLDAFSVNIAYYLALVLRFYVNHEFHEAGTLFLPLFLKFAPYYTVCSLVIFAAFKLYSGIWRYAGLNDLNRVLLANLVTCLVQIVGTLLFIRRMPITYYALGALIQLFLVFFSRFAYRIFAEEAFKLSRDKNTAVNMVIVGAGESARLLLQQWASDRTSLAQPVCVVDMRGHSAGRLFDGLPVVGGVEGLREAAKKYAAKSVVIADSLLSQESRTEIRALCRELGLGVQDLTATGHSANSGLSLRTVLELAGGPVELTLDGSRQRFEDPEAAATALSGNYVVRSICARDGALCAEIAKDVTSTNNINEAWVHDYESETGEEISFF